MRYGKYEYRCSTHGPFRSDFRADSMYCPGPGEFHLAQRVWGVNVAQSFQPHYNPSLGLAINNKSQFQTELDRASEVASAPVTNYLADGTPVVVERPEHHFVPVDSRDKAALGVTNEGLDTTYDRWKQQGRDDDAKKLKALMDE